MIDKQGRLFGKLNIIDLIVFIIVVALIAAIGVRFTSKKLNQGGGNPAKTEQYCYVTLFSSLVVPEVGDQLKADMEAGEHLVANNSFTDAEIVSVEVAPAAYVGTNINGEAVYSEHPLWKDVTVVVKEKVNPSSVILKVGNQEVRVGNAYILKTQKVETNCRIRGIEFKDE